MTRHSSKSNKLRMKTPLEVELETSPSKNDAYLFERLSVCVCAFFPVGLDGMWDLIKLVPDHYVSFPFTSHIMG